VLEFKFRVMNEDERQHLKRATLEAAPQTRRANISTPVGLVNDWFTIGSRLVNDWFTIGSRLVHDWFTSTTLVNDWLTIGSRLVNDWFMIG
jgi:hypothetical protein